MSRIVYVWDSEYPWDVRAEKICAALQRAGHEVHLVARNQKWRMTSVKLPECTVHRMKPWRLLGKKLDNLLSFPAFFSPRWINLISKTVRQVNADLIIVRDLPLCPTAIYIGYRAGIPVIGDFAENYPAMMRAIWESKRARIVDYVARNPRVVELIERFCVARLNRIIVVVQEAADRLVTLGVSRERIVIVSNTPPKWRAMVSSTPAGTTYKRASSPEPTNSPLSAVYLGLLEVARGIEDVLQAAALLRRTKSVRIRLIGDGRDRALLETRAADLGLRAPEVEFVGHLPYKQALQIVAESDVGLIPHVRCEAWDTTIPNKLFDYMAAGKAVVSSDTVPCTRVLDQTKAGKVYQSGNAASLAYALTQLTDNNTRSTCGRAARCAILQQYHWENDAMILRRCVESAVPV